MTKPLHQLSAMPLATSLDRGIIPPGHPEFDPEGDNDYRNSAYLTINTTRAERALSTLVIHGSDTCGNIIEEDVETVLSDLLADIKHLCRMNDVDFDACLGRGDRHHDAEQESING